MKTVTLTLSAGTLVLGPLLAATIRDNRDAIGQSRLGEMEPPELIDLTCTLATACAQRVAPRMQRADVEALIDTENFMAVYSACWGVSLPESAPGEAVAMPSPPT